MKKIQGIAGRWYRSTKYETCCDCGLVHKKEHRIIVSSRKLNCIFREGNPKIKLETRCWRDEKKTKENRKNMREIIKNLL